jgi:hypothetical protein
MHGIAIHAILQSLYIISIVLVLMVDDLIVAKVTRRGGRKLGFGKATLISGGASSGQDLIPCHADVRRFARRC